MKKNMNIMLGTLLPMSMGKRFTGLIWANLKRRVIMNEEEINKIQDITRSSVKNIINQHHQALFGKPMEPLTEKEKKNIDKIYSFRECIEHMLKQKSENQ